MGKRYILKGKSKSFVERSRHGQFKVWTSKGKSLAKDRRIKAKTKVKVGYGHRGDLFIHIHRNYKKAKRKIARQRGLLDYPVLSRL